MTLGLAAPRVPLSSAPRLQKKRERSPRECGVQVEPRSLQEGARSSARTGADVSPLRSCLHPSPLAWELVLEVSGQPLLCWSCRVLGPELCTLLEECAFLGSWLLVLACVQFQPSLFSTQVSESRPCFAQRVGSRALP